MAKQIGQPVQYRVATTGDENLDWAAAQVVAVYGVGHDVLDAELAPASLLERVDLQVAQGISVGQWREIPA